MRLEGLLNHILQRNELQSAWRDPLGCFSPYYACDWLYGGQALGISLAVHINTSERVPEHPISDLHPAKKIPYKAGRCHGRRINGAYGWTRETFEGFEGMR